MSVFLPPIPLLTSFSESLLSGHEMDRQSRGHGCQDWGWNLQDNRLVPVMSMMNAAPDILLKVIHCNCPNSCKTLRCSCRKKGLSVTILTTGFLWRSLAMK